MLFENVFRSAGHSNASSDLRSHFNLNLSEQWLKSKGLARRGSFVDKQTTDSDGKTQTIEFSSDRSALLIIAPVDSKPADIVSALGVPRPQTLIMITGGADELAENLRPQLEQLFSRGIARAAVDVQAVIIDGGTHSGVMSLMGQGVADRGRLSPLIGVAPAPKVTYPGGPAEGSIEGGAALDPNHSHFVLVETPEWGDEAGVMYGLAEELSQNGAAIAVLVNGGPVAKGEVLNSVRHHWPIIVIEGSGRLTDEIARNCRAKQAPDGDPAMAEIITEGNIQLFAVEGSPGELRQLIVRQLYGDHALRLAWERFARYDSNAQRQQKSFRGLMTWILWLGVLATFLVVIHKQLTAILLPANIAARLVLDSLKYIIIAVPISISILVAVSNRFKTGKKWALLRGSAEAIKREIFHYRTRTGSYSEKELPANTSREGLLSRAVGNIARRVSQTEVNELALKRYDGSIPPPYASAETDDGMSVLSPEAYIAGRLDDQMKYFESTAEKIEWRIKWRQIAIYVIGGAGTLLAAIEFQIWIAVTTALATALTAYLEHFQLESTLIKYNQSASDLGNIKSWWRALSKSERQSPANQTLLVESTERVLENELTGWVQRMQDALAKIRAAEETGEEDQNDGTTRAETARPKKQQHLCLVVVSSASGLSTQYEAIQKLIEGQQLACERVDETTSATKIEDLEARIASTDLLVIDFSNDDSNGYYLAGFANANRKKWIALARSDQTLSIKANENGRIVRAGGAGQEEQLATQFKQALEDLGFAP